MGDLHEFSVISRESRHHVEWMNWSVSPSFVQNRFCNSLKIE